jgi:redox-sensitive bicupin YhaK (pirin superfamily)
MMTIRQAGERGHAQHGWLDSFHTFSFADYHDPRHMGFRGLRVINEDRVAPGRGFGKHSHRDMEIISYVLEGALEHQDSMGTGSVIRPGDVQRMSAGTGVAHSEQNASPTEQVHFLQIWIVPARRGAPPGYEQKTFPAAERQGRLRVVASPDGREGSVTIHSDAILHAGLLEAGQTASLPIASGRHAWVHVARGQVRVNGRELGAGDGAALSEEAEVQLQGMQGAPQAPGAQSAAEVLVFDLA